MVEKKAQSSPSDTKKKTASGDFVTAYIDHGVSPEEASYEYLMLVRPTSKEEGKYTKKLPYKVLQADNSAHVVKDDITGITAYISYRGYVSDGTLVASVQPETIVMERRREDRSVVMSICTPDLGITEKGYTTTQPSQVIVKEVVLNGNWTLAGTYDNVSLKHDGGKTVVSASCRHGQPVEISILSK